MPINPDALGATATAERSWSSKDALLYAVGVGAGADDPLGDLQFTTENSKGVDQQVLPTFAVIVGAGGAVMRDAGSWNPAMLVHGEQAIELAGPIPVEGSVTTTSEITGIWDKGKGAVIEVTNRSVDGASGEPRFTTRSAVFIRGEGGWGGERGVSGGRNAAPDVKPDEVVTYSTRADQALLYRLSGDRNPLHSDPAFAAAAGFDRPILHGLCTYGFTGRALLHALCGGDPAKFVSMEGRFSQPVFPGDDLTVSIWVDGDSAIFQTSTGAGIVVDGGLARFRT
ncbi:MAG TPA: MaoC/PaaZ C-terminal domain-containing protein [Acidimicrobiales bacterium]|nr:MaoC/PaaZ C-terminal domain-containing protein [Acidimicrobiales bacterium]